MEHSNVIMVTNQTAKNTTGAQDWTEVYFVVRWIQLVMAVLSILGSGSIIACLMLRRLSRKPELQPLFLLSIADLLLAVCWLIGAILFSADCNSRSAHCYNLHIMEQIFYMASFFYTLNYVWNLYKGIREKYYSCMDGYPVQVSNRVSTAGKLLALVSCLLPVLLMVPVIIEGNLSQCQANFSEPFRCLMMHTGALFLISAHQPIIPACSRLNTYHITIFLITVLFTLLSITVLVVKARCIYRRIVTSNGYLGREQRASFSMMDRRMVLYPSIFVFCWGPAVALAFLRVVDPSACQGKAGVVLYISQVSQNRENSDMNVKMCLTFVTNGLKFWCERRFQAFFGWFCIIFLLSVILSFCLAVVYVVSFLNNGHLRVFSNCVPRGLYVFRVFFGYFCVSLTCWGISLFLWCFIVVDLWLFFGDFVSF